MSQGNQSRWISLPPLPATPLDADHRVRATRAVTDAEGVRMQADEDERWAHRGEGAMGRMGEEKPTSSCNQSSILNPPCCNSTIHQSAIPQPSICKSAITLQSILIRQFRYHPRLRNRINHLHRRHVIFPRRL